MIRFGFVSFLTACGAASAFLGVPGQSQGQYQVAATIPVVENLYDAFALAVSDFTGDGIPDILVGRSGGLSLLIGDGTGRFPSWREFDFRGVTSRYSATVDAIVLADFDGDGRQEVAARCTHLGSVVILRVEDDGILQETGRVPTSKDDGPRGLAAADFDGDGLIDLAVAEASAVNWHRGKGNGEFVFAARKELQGDPVHLMAADLDVDGIADLIVSQPYALRVTIFYGSRSAALERNTNLSTSASALALPYSAQPIFTAAADINSDGLPDLAAAFDQGILIWLTRDSAISTRPQFISRSEPLCLAFVDFDSDGKLDLVAGEYEGHISLWQGDGTGAFVLTGALPSLGDAFQVAATDLNLDGITDLASTSFSGSNALISLGQGSGKFSAPAYHGYLRPASGSGDFFLLSPPPAQNQRPSFSFIAPARRTLYHFQREAAAPDLINRIEYPLAALHNDFDGDGIPDVLLAEGNPLSGEYGETRTLTFRWMPGHQNGEASVPADIAVREFPVYSGFTSKPTLIAGDFVGNSQPGFVASIPDLKTIEAFAGNGDGSFSLAWSSEVPRRVLLAGGDFDADGLTDLVRVTMSSSESLPSGTATVQFTKRGGGLRESLQVYGCSDPIQVLTADFDGNGVTDFAVLCAKEMALLLSAGYGTFQRSIVPLSDDEYSTISASAIDFDGDGQADIAVGLQSLAAGTVKLFLSDAAGTFLPPVELQAPGRPNFLQAAYWDDDTLPDLVVFDQWNGTLTILGSKPQSTPEPPARTPAPPHAQH